MRFYKGTGSLSIVYYALETAYNSTVDFIKKGWNLKV